MKLPKTNKRFKSAWVAIGINSLLFILGIYKGADLSDLGTGLALVNTPLFVYILGETLRPSKLDTDV